MFHNLVEPRFFKVGFERQHIGVFFKKSRIGSSLQELVLPCVHHEKIRLVLKSLLHKRQYSVRGVRYSPEIDDFVFCPVVT